MSSRSTTRASSPNATDPSDPLFAQLFLAFVPCSWLPCSATRVFSLGDLLRRIWTACSGFRGALSTILDATPASLMGSHSVVLWSLVRPIRAEMPWYKRMPPWMAVLAWRPSVLLLRQHMSAAAFAYQPQQAAARMVLPGCLAFSKANSSGRVDVYSAGKGVTAETTPKPCSCFRRPRGCGALPRRRFWFLDRRLWVPSAHRGLLRACLPARLAPAWCSPARLRLPGFSAALPALLRACCPWRFCSHCPPRPRSSRLFFARSWAPSLRLIVDLATCCVLDHPTRHQCTSD